MNEGHKPPMTVNFIDHRGEKLLADLEKDDRKKPQRPPSRSDAELSALHNSQNFLK
jgi:hypothetical protein